MPPSPDLGCTHARAGKSPICLAQRVRDCCLSRALSIQRHFLLSYSLPLTSGKLALYVPAGAEGHLKCQRPPGGWRPAGVRKRSHGWARSRASSWQAGAEGPKRENEANAKAKDGHTGGGGAIPALLTSCIASFFFFSFISFRCVRNSASRSRAFLYLAAPPAQPQRRLCSLPASALASSHSLFCVSHSLAMCLPACLPSVTHTHTHTLSFLTQSPHQPH